MLVNILLMQNKFAYCLACASLISASLELAGQLAPEVPARVQAHIGERVARDLNRALIVGIVSDLGEEYLTAGSLSDASPEPPAKDTLFEIGSVTKLFTAAAAADLVQKRRWTWKTPAAALLPSAAALPSFDDERINIHDLATHSSGLARLPHNLPTGDSANPFAAYNTELLYAGLSEATLPFRPGTFYLYSHFGYGLLGHLLELRTGEPFEAVIAEHITEPLKMGDTVVNLSEGQAARLAPGHKGMGTVPQWDFGALAGAGALKSTAADLITFLRAQMGMVNSPLARTFGGMHAPILPTGSKDTMVGYAWQITRREGSVIYWQNGATGGYASFIGFNPSQRVGVVILTNSAQNIDELGFYILAPDVFPLGQFPPLASVPVATLERYVGSYQMAPGTRIRITRDEGRLYAEITGTPRYRIYPLSKTTFGFANEDIRLNFETSRPSGPVPKVKIEGTVSAYDARRIED